MTNIWNKIFYNPIYNALILIVGTIAFGNIGLAVIFLTIIIKLILFPVSKKSIKSQVMLKKLEPLLKKIKEDTKDKQEQARKTMELYKKHGVSPFSGCLTAIIQIPIILALYYVFFKGISPIDPTRLYSFIPEPTVLKEVFLGINMHSKSIILALLAGVSQFLQFHFMNVNNVNKGIKEVSTDTKRSFQEEMTRSMNLNMKYFMPVIITIFAYQISAAVALYWVVSNVFTIFQEIYVKRTVLNKLPEKLEI